MNTLNQRQRLAIFEDHLVSREPFHCRCCRNNWWNRWDIVIILAQSIPWKKVDCNQRWMFMMSM